jgi:hypothetical protein
MYKTFAYKCGDLVSMLYKHRTQYAVVISRNFLDPDDDEYNEYSVYGQHSGLIAGISEYALDRVENENETF